MVKTVVITETISSCVIRRVNVNQFDLATELLFKRVKRDEVVTLNNEIFADNSVLVPLDVRYVLLAISRIAFPVREDFGVNI